MPAWNKSRDRELDHLREIDQQRRRADELLHVILPPAIAAELKEHDRVQPRLHPDVAVLFADVTGFTDYCGKNPQETVIANLQDLVARFEEISERHGLEKIKTIGDAYMATAGLLQPVKNPALNASRAALEMCAAARKLDGGWRVHVGIHVGPVVAGVVGVVGARKYHFDIWGDTVNTASRVPRRRSRRRGRRPPERIRPREDRGPMPLRIRRTLRSKRQRQDAGLSCLEVSVEVREIARRMSTPDRLPIFAVSILAGLISASAQAASVARLWNEETLAAIRIDFPHPPVHARNLFHSSIAMWDAWAATSDAGGFSRTR